MEKNNNNFAKKQTEDEQRRPPLARDETIDDLETGKTKR